ncbi:agmatine deiminase [Pediococcus siamensis]|uniref:agmatine deiminase n=1 Tax=Pediococcus siamensis TaxID=381829 RepID=UPI0039A3E461
MKHITTPITDGYRLPAEFEKQKKGYMLWPQRSDNWRDGGKPAQKMFSELAALLAQYQPMVMLVNESQYKHAREMLPSSVQVIEMSSNDAYIKDTGPFYVTAKNGTIRCENFNFNAWGGLLDGLYFPWDKDNELAEKIAGLNHLDYYQSQFTLEGCSIIVDGQGTLITTKDVILSEGRNKGVTIQKAEKVFHDFFGVEKVIWLSEGFFMDETGGDIDNMVNFVRPGEVVLTWTEDKNDPQYQISHAALKVLEKETDAKGRKLRIHKLNLPQKALTLSSEEANGVDPINGMLPRVAGQRLTATYVNYITLNDVIIMPAFEDLQDSIAQKQLQKYYPDRKIVKFPAREILTGGGGLHTVVSNVPDTQVRDKK